MGRNFTAQKTLTGTNSENYKDFLFLSTYDNGCSPRITNFGFVNRSASVMSFVNGQSFLAKVKEHMGSHIHRERYIEFDSKVWLDVCVSARMPADVRLLKDTYRPYVLDSFNMVRDSVRALTVPCVLPEASEGEWSVPRIGQASFPGYTGQCKAEISPRSITEDTFHVDFRGCHLVDKDGMRHNKSFSMEFTCLGIYQNNGFDDGYVFTKSKPNDYITNDLQCWIFSNYKTYEFITHVGTCSDTYYHKLADGEKIPMVKLKFPYFSNSAPSRLAEPLTILGFLVVAYFKSVILINSFVE